MNPAKLIGVGELAQLAGISRRQVDNWTRHQYLKDENRLVMRQGSRRQFKPQEVRIAQIMAVLTSAGVLPHKASKAARTAIVLADDKGIAFITELAKGLAVTGRLTV